MKRSRALRHERLQLGIIAGRDRDAAGLVGDEGGQRQEVAALVGQRRRLLMIGAAEVDALVEGDGARQRLVEGRIARRDALHAGRCIAMAVRTGLVGAAGLFRPERPAVEHEKHARIGRVVILHRPRVRPHERIAGAARVRRNFAGEQRRGRGQQCCRRYRAPKDHSTVIEADAVDE
ncbi:hypothetical protein ABIF44_008044 [Bradyrhizobium japonicum]